MLSKEIDIILKYVFLTKHCTLYYKYVQLFYYTQIKISKIFLGMKFKGMALKLSTTFKAKQV